MRRIAFLFILFSLLAAPTWAQTAGTPVPPAEPTPQLQTTEQYLAQAVQNFKVGDLAGAERMARTAVAMDSRIFEAHYLLGRILLYKAAQRNKLLIENQGSTSAILPSDQAWKEGRAELQEAASQFRIAIKLQGQNTSAWLLLATCLDNLGEEDEAINSYKQTINLDPFSTDARDAWNNLGLLYRGQNKLKEAKMAFEAAMAIDPTFSAAKLNLEKLREQKPSLFR